MNDNPYDIKAKLGLDSEQPKVANQQEKQVEQFSQQNTPEKIDQQTTDKLAAAQKEAKQKQKERSGMAKGLEKLASEFKPGGKHGSLSENEKLKKVEQEIATREKFKDIRLEYSQTEKDRLVKGLTDPNKVEFVIDRVKKEKQI